MQVGALVYTWNIVGKVFGKIGIHPDSNLSPTSNEDHLFTDIKVAYLLVKHFETLQRGLQQIELVSEGDIVDLLQPEVHLLQIQQALVDGGA